MKTESEPAPPLDYAGPESGGGFSGRSAVRGLIVALFFAAGVVTGTVPAARVTAADEGHQYPDIDGPNVSAGMVLQVAYGTPAVFVATYLPRRFKRKSMAVAAAGGLLAGTLYALLPHMLWVNQIRVPRSALLAFVLLFPFLFGWALAGRR